MVMTVMQGGKHCLCYHVLSTKIEVMLSPFTDIHTKCISILFGTPVKMTESLLVAQNKVISPDR